MFINKVLKSFGFAMNQGDRHSRRGHRLFRLSYAGSAGVSVSACVRRSLEAIGLLGSVGCWLEAVGRLIGFGVLRPFLKFP